jgi:cob(I)alamin adenosyltransferase
VGKTVAYTGKGDDGSTFLYGGMRVPKDDKRIEALGELDELNAVLGITIGLLDPSRRKIRDLLKAIQQDLFVIGSEIAATGKPIAPRKITEDLVKRIEASIELYNSRLPTLRQFILPLGSLQSAYLHFARAVCRRAERRIVSLAHEHSLNPLLLAYINRLSSLLFVLARYVNMLDKRKEYRVPKARLGKS